MAPRTLKVEAPELRLDPERVVESIDWVEVFGSQGRVEVEIGIGKGRFLLAAATARPDAHYLGVDWANQYLRIAESRATKAGLNNVRFARVDAKELCRAIPDSTVSTYYVFYPDPWPKKRHNKRRFLRPETAEELARTLKPGGMLHVATDHDDYWSTIPPVFDAHPSFERLTEFGGDEFPVDLDQPLTNFEEKYRVEGRSRHRGSWRRRGMTLPKMRSRNSTGAAIPRPPGGQE